MLASKAGLENGAEYLQYNQIRQCIRVLAKCRVQVVSKYVGINEIFGTIECDEEQINC